MNKNWKKYDKQTIFADKKKGGLFVTFLKEYRDEFKVQVNASCPSCFEKYYKDYLNSIKPKEKMSKKKNNCDYELHKKYENITLKHDGERIRNRDLTNELAERLIAEHPHGAKLFSVIKKKSTKKVVAKITMPRPKAKKKTKAEKSNK